MLCPTCNTEVNNTRLVEDIDNPKGVTTKLNMFATKTRNIVIFQMPHEREVLMIMSGKGKKKQKRKRDYDCPILIFITSNELINSDI